MAIVRGMPRTETYKECLAEIRELEDGWCLMGKSFAPKEKDLDWFESTFKGCFAKTIELPHVDATVDGGIELRWRIEQYDLSLVINFRIKEGMFYSTNNITGQQTFKRINLYRLEEWKKLSASITKIKKQGMTVEDIQTAIYHDKFLSQKYFATNLYLYGIIGEEMDMISVSKTGRIAEYEIKVSVTDFKADFKKKAKHNRLRMGQDKPSVCGSAACSIPNYFWFVMPESVYKKLPENSIPEYAGLMVVRGRFLEAIKSAPTLHKTIFDQDKINAKLVYSLQSTLFKERKK